VTAGTPAADAIDDESGSVATDSTIRWIAAALSLAVDIAGE